MLPYLSCLLSFVNAFNLNYTLWPWSRELSMQQWALGILQGIGWGSAPENRNSAFNWSGYVEVLLTYLAAYIDAGLLSMASQPYIKCWRQPLHFPSNTHSALLCEWDYIQKGNVLVKFCFHAFSGSGCIIVWYTRVPCVNRPVLHSCWGCMMIPTPDIY